MNNRTGMRVPRTDTDSHGRTRISLFVWTLAAGIAAGYVLALVQDAMR